MARDRPLIEPPSKPHANRHEDQCACNRAKPNHKEERARDWIADEFERPWQAGDDNQCQYEYADDAINQHRISRASPPGAPARKQPDPCAIPANGRWQHLVEKCGDETDLQCRSEGQIRAARGGDRPPACGKQGDLNGQEEKRQYDPTGLEPAQPLGQCADVNPTQREIEQ
jgi:hypothetical protein